MKPGFAYQVLNSLGTHVAVLDAQGHVVAVNEAWRRFARENGGDARAYVGASYLAVCEDARRGGDAVAEAVLAGIAEVRSGERDTFAVEYPCHSPDVERWFVARISRFLHRGRTYLLTAHEDVTARKQAENRLRRSEYTLRDVLEALPVGVWIMDKTGKIVHGNPAGRRIWGGARYVGPDRFDEYRGWWLETGKPIAADEWAATRAIRNGETSIDEEIRIECFDGSSKIILNSAMPLRDRAGTIVGAIIVNQDITARKQVEEELRTAHAALDEANRELHRALAREQRKARTDELTGLNNRRHFYELARNLFRLARRHRTPLSVLIFDIDHFKQINDRYGHLVGDAILRRVARTVRERLRRSDVVARYGGEEFVAALPHTAAPDALAVAEELRASIGSSRERIDDVDVAVTISVGIAELADADRTLGRLINRADQALYAAKRAGRNCTRIAAPPSGAQA